MLEQLEREMERRSVMPDKQVDRQLLVACQSGDREAFRLLFEVYQERIYTLALHYFGGNPDAAKDALQQVFLKLFTVIGQFRHDSQFTTWLYRVAINVCLDEQRRRQPLVSLENEEPLTSLGKNEVSPDELILQHEVDRCLSAAIANLKPKLRIPILLKYLEDLSYEEIAQVLGCSKGTVASRLNRGHTMLARNLAHLRGALTAGD
jgi:RNA polymerase sigma-70 factor (ECF subfamily)